MGIFSSFMEVQSTIFILQLLCLLILKLDQLMTRNQILDTKSLSVVSFGCYIENDNNFERNEDCATVFLKWTVFNSVSKKTSIVDYFFQKFDYL